MRWRKRKKEESEQTAEPLSDKAANKIAGMYTKVQHWFAQTMSKSINGMQVKRLKTVVVVFFLLAGGGSVCILVDALVSSVHGTKAVHIEQATVPRHFNKTGSEVAEDLPLVDENTMGQIRRFRVRMDSLRLTDRIAYDSILAARPHLFDSVTMIEQLYREQKH